GPGQLKLDLRCVFLALISREPVPARCDFAGLGLSEPFVAPSAPCQSPLPFQLSIPFLSPSGRCRFAGTHWPISQASSLAGPIRGASSKERTFGTLRRRRRLAISMISLSTRHWASFWVEDLAMCYFTMVLFILPIRRRFLLFGTAACRFM